MTEAVPTVSSRVPKTVRYVISGGTAAFINIGTLFVLTHFFGVWYLTSSIIAFLIALQVSFALQRLWTFEVRSTEGLMRHSTLYFIVAVINTLINTGIVFVLVEYVSMWYVAAQIIAGLAIAMTSFFIYRRIFHT